MLVILKDQTSVRLIEGITLTDGYLPSVGDFKPVWLQDGLPQIEPALWFKTRVISCVLLDVSYRLITWSTQPITEKHLEHFRSCDPESIVVAMDLLDTQSKLDRETQDLDASYDEMFEAAEYLLVLHSRVDEASALPKRKRRKMTLPDQTTINKIIVKLLHCYVVPSLKLKPEDLPLVEERLRIQEQLIADIDKDLEKKMNNVAQTKGALQIKRHDMVNKFQEFKEVMTYPKEILFLLESQFQEDIKQFNMDLNTLQDEINELKEKNGDAIRLKEKRKQRDDLVDNQVKFLMARENIVNAVALEKPRLKANSFRTWYVREEGEFVICDMGKYDMHSALGMYAKVHEILQTERDERALLIAKKNLMISVREAIRETQICLSNGEVTTGSSNNKTRSRRATDVLNSSVPDQWLTLSERVSEFLTSAGEHQTRHVNFVKQVNDKLLAAVSVAKLAYRETTDTVLRLQRRRRSHYLVRREFQSMIMTSKENHKEVRHEVATLLRSRADSCKNFRRRIDSIIQMSDEEPKQADDNDENEIIQEQIKNEIRLIQAQIHAHFDMMSSELQTALDEVSEVAYFKIWLCYEVHFYETVMDELIKLYQLSYRLICSNLKRNSAYVTFEDLGVQDQWLLDLLFKKAEPGEEVVDIEDVTVSVEEKRDSMTSIVTTSSSGSDLDNLNSLVKRLSVYQESPRLTPFGSPVLYETELETINKDAGIDVESSECDTTPDQTALETSTQSLPNVDAQKVDTDIYPQMRPGRKNRSLPAGLKPGSVRQPAYRSDNFREVFAIPIRLIHAIIHEETPLYKLQLMTKCVRQIQKAVTNRQEALKRQDGGLEIIDEEESLMCCDDFLTILTLILLHLEPKTVSHLYPHVVMLTDFMAPFLTNGLHSNSLTHFYGAFQIIFSTMVIKHSVSPAMLD